ncbi:MAG TPA: hypothetical protein VF896_15170 [Anaerolineales bacterium]
MKQLSVSMKEYRADLLQRYWKYQEVCFADKQEVLDSNYPQSTSPPVFVRNESWRNIIINPTASEREKKRLLDLMSEGDRHKWFRSMNSSQALAQSVLGNLFVYGLLDCLSELKDEEGMDLFGKSKISSSSFEMEHKIRHLGESRSTSLDGYFSGDYQIAIECKFTEPEVGTCSRPKLEPKDSNYESEHCNGTYSIQRGRTTRCSLTEMKISYWDFVPKLFNWQNNINWDPCPLNKN